MRFSWRKHSGYDQLSTGSPTGAGRSSWGRGRLRLGYLVKIAISTSGIIGLLCFLYVLSEGWRPRHSDGILYAADWRYHCDPDRASHFSYRENFGLWSYRPVEPLRPIDPAWPYASDAIPQLSDGEGMQPATVLIGVMTMDKGIVRRKRIRETYNSHPRSRANGTEGVRVIFVQGQPSEKWRDTVMAEAKEYGDMLILPIAENMNRGKSQTFMEWASEHARVPNCTYLPNAEGEYISHCSGEKRPDFVMKADDDAFINLSELEKRLRIMPKTKSYWGWLMSSDGAGRHWGAYDYNSGQGYAMSIDLVDFIATRAFTRWYRWGDEDQMFGNALRFHPKMEEIVWVRDPCWVYDHPRAQKPLSHGYLMPNTVAQSPFWTDPSPPISIPQVEYRRPSTVVPEGEPYEPPLHPSQLNRQQQLEAMFEESPLSFLNRHNIPDDLSEQEIQEWVKQTWDMRPSDKERYRDKGRGATVLVHQVKSDEWWMEATAALLGPA